MQSKSHIRGHLSLLAIGVLVLIACASVSGAGTMRYQQLAASAEPSAADQIWQIGNQPIGYLQTMPTAQTDTQINTQNVWGQIPAFDNIQIQSPTTNYYTGNLQQFQGTTQGDVWSQLDSQVQSSEAQVANNPIQQSTFEAAPPDLSSWQAEFMGNNADANAQVNDTGSSWFDSMTGTAVGWYTGVHDYFFGSQDANGCPDGSCDVETLGIRG